MAKADALLVIDMQNGVCFENGEIFNYTPLVKRINESIQEYQTTSKPIIFVQHQDEYLAKDSEVFKIVSDLNSEAGTHFITKTHANAFYNTNLNEVLTDLNIKSLEICGAETPFCVDSTVKFAHGLKYKLFMKKHMTTTNYNDIMTPQQTIKFYEMIWNKRFVEFVD